jgi:biotin operon repressor
MENYNAIVSFFKATDKPVSAGQVAEATGIDRKEVDKVMKQLKAEEAIVSPKKCYWEIKK